MGINIFINKYELVGGLNYDDYKLLNKVIDEKRLELVYIVKKSDINRIKKLLKHNISDEERNRLIHILDILNEAFKNNGHNGFIEISTDL